MFDGLINWFNDVWQASDSKDKIIVGLILVVLFLIITGCVPVAAAPVVLL